MRAVDWLKVTKQKKRLGIWLPHNCQNVDLEFVQNLKLRLRNRLTEIDSRLKTLISKPNEPNRPNRPHNKCQNK